MRTEENFAHILHQDPVFETVGRVAARMGVPVYVVGGFVRDLIMKRTSKDIDFACVGSGIELAQGVAEALGPEVKFAFFKNFGTAMIRYEDRELEFVGARKESYRNDSRKPIVENGTLEEDQHRRDFTINAMAIDLSVGHFGQLLDPFNGLQDIRRKMIRTPLEPEVTFSDDPLRMMRAIRFATQLNFDIDPVTFEAIAAQKERIHIVSMERITEELNKIILAETPSYGFKLLYQAGLLEIIFPEFVKLKGVETVNGIGHKDNFYHTLKVLDNISQATNDLWLRWSAILHDIAKPPTKRFDPRHGWTFHGHEEKGARMVPGLFKRFRLPLNEKMKSVQKLVRMHLRPIALVKDTVTESAIRRLIVEAGEDLEGLMILCRADITSKDDNKVKKYLANFDKLEKKIIETEANDQLRNFQPVISGEIIMETFGLKPSKEVGDLKHDIREAILEGEVSNQLAPAFQYLLELGRSKGYTPLITSAETFSGRLPQPESTSEEG